MNGKPGYLSAMGIAQWVRRDRPYDRDKSRPSADAFEKQGESTVQSSPKIVGQSKPDRSNDLSDIDSLSTSPQSISAGSLLNNPWIELQSQVHGCQLCDLHKSRTNTVFGVGNEHADWMVIGEAPGADEDRAGEPFVGRAGKLLDEMMFALGFQRNDIFIANILKCRPPNNRDPLPDEVSQCEHYLQRQISLIKPKIILAVGRIAAQNLLKTETPIGKMRGNRYCYDYLVNDDAESTIADKTDSKREIQIGEMGSQVKVSIPVVVTYHPAYLLRSPREKRKAWQDLKLAKSIMQSVESESQIDERQPKNI